MINCSSYRVPLISIAAAETITFRVPPSAMPKTPSLITAPFSVGIMVANRQPMELTGSQSIGIALTKVHAQLLGMSVRWSKYFRQCTDQIVVAVVALTVTVDYGPTNSFYLISDFDSGSFCNFGAFASNPVESLYFSIRPRFHPPLIGVRKNFEIFLRQHFFMCEIIDVCQSDNIIPHDENLAGVR